MPLHGGDLMSLEEFQILKQRWSLEEKARDTCPACDNIMIFYGSKYIEGVNVRFCHNCYELEVGTCINPNQENICPICGDIVKYEKGDEDCNNYVICDDKDCSQKAHRSCVEDFICEKCNIWVCAKHESEYLQCEYCECFHDEGCFVSLSNEFIDTFGYICEDCFYRDNDLIEEIKRPLTAQYLIEYIDRNRNFYVTEAKENFDLSIMLTHLIRSDSPWELLKKILSDGCLKASETGYYGKIEGTKAICFTDLTVRGLLRHSKKYSPFGIAFLKELVYEKGGGPALYIRDDIIKNANYLPEDLKPFINKINLRNYDFHHEREWRIPKNFYFDLEEISIVYTPIKYHEEIRRLFPQIKVLVDLDLLLLI